ncbi:hypothetical protein LR48_Vigan08g025600 [Vigna angularis]|uniref:Uncharacterized protein n=1 Tax=Phaseolus angularis TaxID=3914 RepID=A0A0L9V3Z3_PHAAN|nr:hypothetical protein LR48_Vigan08g025600 [Vigna angularis]
MKKAHQNKLYLVPQDEYSVPLQQGILKAGAFGSRNSYSALLQLALLVYSVPAIVIQFPACAFGKRSGAFSSQTRRGGRRRRGRTEAYRIAACWTSVLCMLDERPFSSKWRPGAPFYIAPGRETLCKCAPGRPFSHARARPSRVLVVVLIERKREIRCNQTQRVVLGAHVEHVMRMRLPLLHHALARRALRDRTPAVCHRATALQCRAVQALHFSYCEPCRFSFRTLLLRFLPTYYNKALASVCGSEGEEDNGAWREVSITSRSSHNDSNFMVSSIGNMNIMASMDKFFNH